jgi:hypothetical protein
MLIYFPWYEWLRERASLLRYTDVPVFLGSETTYDRVEWICTECLCFVLVYLLMAVLPSFIIPY